MSNWREQVSGARTAAQMADVLAAMAKDLKEAGQVLHDLAPSFGRTMQSSDLPVREASSRAVEATTWVGKADEAADNAGHWLGMLAEVLTEVPRDTHWRH